MDTTFLKSNSSQALLELFRRILLEVNTAIPGEIVNFDPSTQTATVRPCIRGTSISNTGETQYRDMPQIVKVPVWFPYSISSGFSMTYPVGSTDQCLLIFSQRSFDNWLKYGSVQNPSETKNPRSHQYSDVMALVGLIPNPSAIQNFQMDGMEIRNKNRDSYVKVLDDKILIHTGENNIVLNLDGSVQASHASTTIQISAAGEVTVTTPQILNINSAVVNISGDINLTGSIFVSGVVQSPQYNVGSGNNVDIGVSGSSDFPAFKGGIVIGS